MKKQVDLYDLYFYKGKYRTEEGMKRQLIKEGNVWVSPKKNYYRFEEWSDYFYDIDTLHDYAERFPEYICSKEDLKHFRKWVNKMIAQHRISVAYTSWYHTDNYGFPTFFEALDDLMGNLNIFNPKYPDEFIETVEESCDRYIDTLTEKEFAEFQKLPDDKQLKLGMKWRIKVYNEAALALAN